MEKIIGNKLKSKEIKIFEKKKHFMEESKFTLLLVSFPSLYLKDQTLKTYIGHVCELELTNKSTSENGDSREVPLKFR